MNADTGNLRSHDSTPIPITRRRWIGLLLGPLLAATVYCVLPAEMRGADGLASAGVSQSGRAVAATGTLMAILWITEALPIPVTALLPIVLLPSLTRGDIGIRSATSPYAHELIFLFMGGFLIALAMQRWGLHRRIALRTILLMGTSPKKLVAGFMLASAFLSMWVSNTATVVMMLPIARSVIQLVRRQRDQENADPSGRSDEPFPFAICLLLGTAYAASIGGMATLIGTPPNTLLAAYLMDQHQIEISFVRWMGVGLPLVVVFLPITWFVLTSLIFPIRLKELPGSRHMIRRELQNQGPLSRGELAVLIVFLCTAALWIVRPMLVSAEVPGGPWIPGLSDAGIAMGAALVLFALPIEPGRGVFVLSWKDAEKLPWGVLLLFGGGLSLASAVQSSGLAAFLGQCVGGIEGLSTVWLVLIITATMVFLTELTSNTATTATFLPILGAVAIGLGINPLMLVVPAALAASCAFMMPVATPPNAIVFSSGELTIPQMCKAGLWLNFIGIALIMALMYGVVVRVLVS